MRRRPGRGRLLLAAFVALAVAVITLDYRAGSGGILKRAKEWSVAIVAPVQRGFTVVFRPVGDFFASLGEIPDLRERVRELEAANEQLAAENERYDDVLADYNRLSDLLGVQRDWSAMDSVAGRVFGADPGNYTSGVYIDKGRADGLRAGMPVLTVEGLVGRTFRVHERYSMILLITDPDFGAAARIEGVRDSGLVEGNGIGRPLTMSYVGKNSDVEVGDEVLTSGGDGIFPPNIPVGEVVRAEVRGGETSKLIEIAPYAEVQRLDYVLVLLTEGPSGRFQARGGG